MPVDRSRLPAVLEDRPFVFPTILHHTTRAGLRVRLVHRPDTPVVTFVLQVEGGAGADPRGREGLAALTADMLDEGTGEMTALDVSEALARIGAEYDLDIGADVTSITLTTLSRFAPRGASLLAAVATQPALRESDFERVRRLRLDRLRQLRDLPPALAERAFLRVLYGEHPYGHLPIGRTPSLEAAALDDVVSFHRRAYRPSRATVVVAGPLPPDEAIALVEDAFAEWRDAPGAADPPVAPDTIPPPAAPLARLAVVVREGAAQSELRLGRLAAPRNTPDYFPLLVLNAVMGGQFTSRINLRLREEKGYTYGARTGFDWRRGMAPFALQTSVHTRATVDAIRDALAELDAIAASRPPTNDELAVARASLTRGYPRNFETVPQVARAVAQLALFGLPDTYFETFAANVNAVTVDEVTEAARRYLDPSRMATVIVGDHPAIGTSLDELGLGAPQLIDPE